MFEAVVPAKLQSKSSSHCAAVRGRSPPNNAGHSGLDRDGRFITEVDLVQAIRGTFARTRAGRWRWMAEVESSNGIADLVAFRLSKHWASALVLGRIPPRWAYALKWLPLEQEFEARWFAEVLNTTPGSARQVLNSYLEAGYCRFNARGKTWRKINEPCSPVDRVVAIEAKLRDWRRALYQARRYLDYATQSWSCWTEASCEVHYSTSMTSPAGALVSLQCAPAETSKSRAGLLREHRGSRSASGR